MFILFLYSRFFRFETFKILTSWCQVQRSWVKKKQKDVKYYDRAKYAVLLAFSLQFNKFVDQFRYISFKLVFWFRQACLRKFKTPVLFYSASLWAKLVYLVGFSQIVYFCSSITEMTQYNLGEKKSRRAALDPTAKKQIEPVLLSFHLKCWTTTKRMAWLAVLSRGVRVANDNISKLPIKLYV